MKKALVYRAQLLTDLRNSVNRAAKFFLKVDESLYDGHQSARDVLSHLVFWHREYCSISKALLSSKRLPLLSGSLAVLNEEATIEYQELDMEQLALCLIDFQDQLENNLLRLEDWSINFPLKKGCRKIDVAGRICSINDHIRHHLVRQERAKQRGEEWIKAYYSEPTS